MTKLVHPENFNLFNWVSNQRTFYKRGELSKKQIDILESLPNWTWEPYKSRWTTGFSKFKKNPKVGRGFVDKDGYRLGAWIERQRADYLRGRLSEEKINLMESVSGWEWSPDMVRWKDKLNLSIKYGTVTCSFETKCGVRLGSWQNKQRVDRKKGKLTKEQIKLIETIPGWKWSFSNKERAKRSLMIKKTRHSLN